LVAGIVWLLGSHLSAKRRRQHLSMSGVHRILDASWSGAKRREAELVRSKDFLEFAQAAGGFGVFDLNLVTRKMSGSALFFELIGLPAGDMTLTQGQWLATIHPEDFVRFIDQFNAAVERYGDYRAEYRSLRIDGTVRWLASRGRVLTEEHGQPRRLIGTITDVTERKLLEEKLRAASHSLLIAQTNAGIATFDFNFAEKKYFATDNYHALRALPSGTPLDDFDTLLAQVHPEDLARMRQAPFETSAAEPFYRCEYRVLENGRARWVGEKATVEHDVSGGITRILGAVVDITDLKRTEAVAQGRALRMGALARPGRARRRRHAHLARGLDAAHHRPQARRAGGARCQARGRGRQSRQEQLPREREPRDPHAHERRDRHVADPPRRARRHAARVRRHHPRQRPGAALADQRRARSLEDRGRPLWSSSRWTSTCATWSTRPWPPPRCRPRSRASSSSSTSTRTTRRSRAATRAAAPDHHEPDRQRRSSSRTRATSAEDLVHPAPDGNSVLRIEVTDTGIGIPADRLDRLFNPSRRSTPPPRATTAARASGSPSSSAWPSSWAATSASRANPGKGSEFWVTLPILARDQGRPEPRGRGRRMLIVDDLAASRASLATKLKLFSFETVAVASVDEALEVPRQARQRFDCVLADELMPVKGGLDLLAALRADPRYARLPFVLLSLFGADHGAIAEGRIPPTPSGLKPIRASTSRSSWPRCSPAICRAGRSNDRAGCKATPTFRGARILLVEDNPVNQRVAQRLLQKLAADVVTIANNGAEALERIAEGGLRCGADGLPDAGHGRLHRHPAASARPSASGARQAPAHHRPHRERHERGSRALHRRRHGRAPRQADRARRKLAIA
jgi:PAS domain S-box-containing protein